MADRVPVFRERPSPRHRHATADEVERARVEYDRHIASMFAPPVGDLRPCIAEDCGEAFPCRRYRAAEAVLRAAGVLGSVGEGS